MRKCWPVHNNTSVNVSEKRHCLNVQPQGTLNQKSHGLITVLWVISLKVVLETALRTSTYRRWKWGMLMKANSGGTTSRKDLSSHFSCHVFAFMWTETKIEEKWITKILKTKMCLRTFRQRKLMFFF